MCTILKVFIEFVTILLLLCFGFLATRHMWDLSSPTRDRTRTPCTGRQSLNHWTAREVPWANMILSWKLKENPSLNLKTAPEVPHRKYIPVRTRIAHPTFLRV